MVRIGDLKTNKGVDVASTASMTLGAGNFFNITGSTAITSITIKPVGTLVVLQFAAIAAIVRDGNNLQLNDDYFAENTGAGNTLTLVSDGTDWIEIARFPTKVNSITGSGSRDMSIASGTQVISGLTFRPTTLIIFASNQTLAPAAWGLGASNGSPNAGNLYDYNGNIGNAYAMSSGAILTAQISGGPNTSYVGTLTSFDDDGFTLTWARNGTPTGTLSFRYLAIQ